MALFLVEQQMPGMTGIDFFEQAIALFPEVKRILLTDVETDAEIRKIKTANIDCYLLNSYLAPNLANRIHGYTGEVRLRGLLKNQRFLTCVGRFCLQRRGFNRKVQDLS